LSSYPRLLWLYFRSLREDDEAKEVVGNEVEARYLAGLKTAQQSPLATYKQRRYG